MPEFATLSTNVPCWNCDAVITDAVDFQWGKVPSTYKCGDRIKWLQVDGSQVPPFVLIEGLTEWNCGDPDIEHIIALDCNVYGIDSGVRHYCQQCGLRYSAVGVEISEGQIVGVHCYSGHELGILTGEQKSEADIFVVNKAGEIQARPDLLDHPIQYVKEFP